MLAQARQRYIRYSDDVEVKQPNEEAIIQETMESRARQAQKMFEKNRHAIRDASAKNHGILKATVQVYNNLPEPLAQGVFKVARIYPAIIRFSTSFGAIQPDKKSFLRGMAIKLIGVEGNKFLPEEKDALTQDFLLANYPIIPTGTVEDYRDAQLKLEKAADGPEVFQNFQNMQQVAARKLKQLVGIEHDPNKTGQPGSHILGDVYFSMAAIRYGDYIAKISAAPLSENVKALHGKEMDEKLVTAEEENFLTIIVTQFFKHEKAEYELRAQLCTDLEKMPVEDGSVQWSEKESPYIPVAKLTIEPQDVFSPARRVYGDDVLSFNPFHCLPEHRPSGNIMRIRRKVYENSSGNRHSLNASPRKEPANIDELSE